MDWQVVLNDLKSRYKALTYLMAQPKAVDSESAFMQKKTELIEEVSDTFDYWDKLITKIHEPVPPVVSKEYNNLRYESMIVLDYFDKFQSLMFSKICSDSHED